MSTARLRGGSVGTVYSSSKLLKGEVYTGLSRFVSGVPAMVHVASKKF